MRGFGIRGSGINAAVALLGVLAIGVGMGGCGGGSSASSAASSSSTSSSASTTSSAAVTSASTSTAAPTSSKSAAAQAPATASKQGETAYEKQVKTPTYVDPSITKYGQVASSGEAAAVKAAINSYYVALAAHEGAKACAMLTPRLKEVMTRLLARAPQLKGKGCAGVLPLLLGETSGKGPPKPSEVHIKSVRVQNSNGFVILSAPGLPAGVMHVQKINGKWAVGTPTAVPAP